MCRSESRRRSDESSTSYAFAVSGRLAVALTFALVAVAHAPRIAAQGCVGDCDSNLVLAPFELVLGVRIGLGAEPLSRCSSFDVDGSATVDVDELLRAVQASIDGCPDAVRIRATCLLPGADGLEPCPAGGIVRVALCDQRASCLFDSHRVLVASITRTGGVLDVVVRRERLEPGPLVFEARIGDEATRALVIVSAADLDAGRIEAVLDPTSEAAFVLLAETGLDVFDDEGAAEVLAAVRQATVTLDFAGLGAGSAAALALGVARADAGVREVIARRATPTATPTLTRTTTPTPTRTPTPTPRAGECVPDPPPTPSAADVVTLTIGSASGPPGGRICLGASLRTNDFTVAGLEMRLGVVPEAPIDVVDGSFACASGPGLNNSLAFVAWPPGCSPGVDCESVRVLVFDLSGLPDADVFFTCRATIAPDAPPGGYPLVCENPIASGRLGTILPFGCPAGTVSVVAAD